MAVVLLILLAALSFWLYRGNTAIQTTRIRVGGARIPVSFRGFTIVQVSDLHNAEFGAGQEKLLGAVKEASPDLIAVTGDLIDSRRTNVEKAMDFIAGAAAVAPVCSVTGNHEARTDQYPILKKRMEEAGVTILDNRGVTIRRGGDSIRLLGLEDPAFVNPDGTNAENAAVLDARLKEMLKESGGSGYTILLSHRPEQFGVYAANGVDLVLCGHAHGGQIRLPFAGGLFAPNQGFFPKYSEGIYQKGRTRMAVSRGLGNSLAPVRIHNRPELMVMTLS